MLRLLTNTPVVQADQSAQVDLGIGGASTPVGHIDRFTEVSVKNENTPEVSSVSTKPSQFAKVVLDTTRVHTCTFYFDNGEVVTHASRHVHEEVRLGTCIGPLLKVRVSSFVYLATHAKRKVAPDTPQPMIQLI
jgi:hypothetical protein